MNNLGIESGKTIKNKKFNKEIFRDNFELAMLVLPGFILTFIFSYLPMIGVIIAFKKFNPNLGILASPWVGFDNFIFFFTSNDFVQIMRNTILYSLNFLILDNVASLGLAILLYNVHKKCLLKYYQTTSIFPSFLSLVLITYIVYAILNPVSGVANRFIGVFGVEGIDWYSNPKYWPFILTIVQIWKGIGIQSIIYYAALMGIDESLFDAAKIDGATRWQEIRFIMIPEISNIICIYLILGIGGLVGGDFGLFYQVPMNIGVLYPTTDIISTYVFRALQQGTNMGSTAAIGLFQSFSGLILVVVSNLIVRKVSPEKSLF